MATSLQKKRWKMSIHLSEIIDQTLTSGHHRSHLQQPWCCPFYSAAVIDVTAMFFDVRKIRSICESIFLQFDFFDNNCPPHNKWWGFSKRFPGKANVFPNTCKQVFDIFKRWHQLQSGNKESLLKWHYSQKGKSVVYLYLLQATRADQCF